MRALSQRKRTAGTFRARFLKKWDRVQRRYARVPGERGIRLRARHYPPFFARFGRDVSLADGCYFTHPDRIVLNDGCRVNGNVWIYGSGGVWIGRRTLIGPHCFIHSANHDTTPGPKVFAERSYDYKTVVIGDNVLISAAVKIMPGAEIGSGSFVAAGALVPGRHFSAESVLKGLPAKATPTEPAPGDRAVRASPSIAFVARSANERSAAARHILSSLGVPQVAVCPVDEIPGSCHTVILMDPGDFTCRLREDLTVWRIDESDATPRVDVPAPHFVHGTGQFGTMEGLEASVFWMVCRLLKNPAPVSRREVLEWLISSHILLESGCLSEKALATVIASLAARTYGANAKRLKRILATPPSARRAAIRNTIAASARPPTSLERLRARLTATLNSFARKYLGRGAFHPISLPPAALLALAGDFGESGPRSQEPRRTVGSGDAVYPRLIELARATMIRVREEADGFVTNLKDEGFFRGNGPFPRTTLGSSTPLYSPLVFAIQDFLLSDNVPQVHRETVFNRILSVVQEIGTHPATRSAPCIGDYVDRESRIIRGSLIKDWLSANACTAPSDKQLVVVGENYHTLHYEMSQLFLKLFRIMQQERGQPFVRLLPWPAPYRAAFSLRYDVDRPISVRRASDLLACQRRHFGAPAGSWYYLHYDQNREKAAKVLARSFQDVGTHARAPEDIRPGDGVTHHSAPSSGYWAGDCTVRSLEEKEARYVEFLAGQSLYPRPIWDGGQRRVFEVWATPLHFPLEGSTADRTLRYFEGFLAAFRLQRARGGHLIVGSHPDLRHQLLARLIRREGLDGLWMCTVADAVDRCRKVYEAGRISQADVGSSFVSLQSSAHVADLQMDIWLPDSDSPSRFVTHLRKGYRRTIPLG